MKEEKGITYKCSDCPKEVRVIYVVKRKRQGQAKMPKVVFMENLIIKIRDWFRGTSPLLGGWLVLRNGRPCEKPT